jgi:hypothetical protein
MIRRWPCTLTWEITKKMQWQWGEQWKTMKTINLMVLQEFHIPYNSIPTHPTPMKGGKKTTTHNSASKWLGDDHTQQCKKWLKEGDNNEVSLFAWKKDHKDDQPHMIKRWPCTIMQYRTIKGNDNEMMIACMHTCSQNCLTYFVVCTLKLLHVNVVMQLITQGEKITLGNGASTRWSALGNDYTHTSLSIYKPLQLVMQGEDD